MNIDIRPQCNTENNKPMLIVLMGNTFDVISKKYGDFDAWIKQALGENDLGETNIEVIDAKTDLLPNPLHYAGVILTGSHAMVTDQEPWSQAVANWLYICRSLNTPMLGICYGHQLIAQSFGGWVKHNPKGLEIGTHQIYLNKDAKQDVLFKDFPAKFMANVVHYQSVMQLPDGAVLLAENPHDAYQAYRLDDHIWGVQFHPEFHLHAMQGYIDVLTEKSLKEDLEITHRLAITDNSAITEHLTIDFLSNIRAEPTPIAQKLIRRFQQYCQNQAGIFKQTDLHQSQ